MSINTKCFIIVTKKTRNKKRAKHTKILKKCRTIKESFKWKIFFLFFLLIKIPLYFDLAYGVVK